MSMANAENDKIKFSERYIVLQRWSIFTSILGALLTIIFSKLLSELTFGTTNYYFWFVILSVNFIFSNLTSTFLFNSTVSCAVKASIIPCRFFQ